MHLPKHPVKRSKDFFKLVRHTPEGEVFISALIVLSFILTILLASLFFFSERSHTIAKVFVLNAFGGRGPAVGLCLWDNWPSLYAFGYNMLLELFNTFLSYSLFVLSVNHYLEYPWLIRFRNRIEKVAIRFEHLIHRYGAIGVFLFVSIPLPMTGPVIGSIMAYFMRFSVRKTMAIVIPGCTVAITAWVFFFNAISGNRQLFIIVMVSFIVIAIIGTLKALPSLIRGGKGESEKQA